MKRVKRTRSYINRALPGYLVVPSPDVCQFKGTPGMFYMYDRYNVSATLCKYHCPMHTCTNYTTAHTLSQRVRRIMKQKEEDMIRWDREEASKKRKEEEEMQAKIEKRKQLEDASSKPKRKKKKGEKDVKRRRRASL